MSASPLLTFLSRHRFFVAGLLCLAGLVVCAGCLKKEDDAPPPDTTAPTVTMQPTYARIPVDGSVDVIVQASEALVELNVASFSVTNGVPLSLTNVDSSRYTLHVQAVSTSGNLSVTLPVGSCVDQAGNGIQTAVSTQIEIAATVSLQLVGIHQAGGHDVADIAIEFSEPVNGFAIDDIEVVNGSADVPVADGDRRFLVAVAAITVHQPIQVFINNDGVSVPSLIPVQTAASLVVDIRPAWSSDFGYDSFGMWADLTVNAHSPSATQRFRWIPAGTFTMGTPDTELGRYVEEGPQHQVTLTQAYWMADTVCTQGFWFAVKGNNPSFFTGDDQLPAEQVSWDSLIQPTGFLEVLNGQVPSLHARLPTEAQWEYACRAGTAGPFAIPEVNWNTVNCFPSATDPYVASGTWRNHTVPVKSLGMVNSWGLYDMHGNVSAWCWDRYSNYSSDPVMDPSGPTSGAVHIYRGGGYMSYGSEARSGGTRGTGAPTYYSDDLGFRLLVPVMAAASPSSAMVWLNKREEYQSSLFSSVHPRH